MDTMPSRSYTPVSDKELVALARDGGSGAFSLLSERYMPLLKNRAGRYSRLAGADSEDFLQEGMLALFRAVTRFDADMGVRFSTYAITCIENSMSTAIKTHMKHIAENTGISIDEDNLKGGTLETGGFPEDAFIEREDAKALTLKIEALLSNFERQVLKLYLRGHSYIEISQLMSTSTKAVDNALQRVRRKLKAAL